ncbi:hypothetical protein CISIN_1g0122371mg, partial [Citrus sinensis]
VPVDQPCIALNMLAAMTDSPASASARKAKL